MVFRQAASGKFPCEAVMAEASAALEAESVPWSKAWFRWLGAIENGRVFRRFSGKSWENHGKMMTIRVFWILYGTFCDFVRAPGKK